MHSQKACPAKLERSRGFVIPLVIAIVALLAVGGYYMIYVKPIKTPIDIKPVDVTSTLVGGDKDEHGCLGPAGYSWCAVKNKCLRVWEEKCEVVATTTQATTTSPFMCKTDRDCREISCPAGGGFAHEQCVSGKCVLSAETRARCTAATTSPVVCTMDAMQCPDGSWIGRSGPDCKFVCPKYTVNSVDLKKCVNNLDCQIVDSKTCCNCYEVINKNYLNYWNYLEKDSCQNTLCEMCSYQKDEVKAVCNNNVCSAVPK